MSAGTARRSFCAGSTSISARVNSLRSWGRRGPGRSTLLGILGMLDGDFEGEFHFLDQPVHQLKPRRRAELNKQHIGFVFQSYHLLDDMTVYENLDLPLSYRNVSRKERQSIVADVLDRFHIVAKKDLFPNQLSGGQQQLVAVARAIVARPKLILADEPTGNLHSAQGKEIMELFKKLNEEETTIIQVTHIGRQRRVQRPHHQPARWLGCERRRCLTQACRSSLRRRATVTGHRRTAMPKVLIADDQPDVLTALRLLLKGEGYETKTAATPAQVLDSVSADEFDVVLIDLNYTRDTTSGQEGARPAVAASVDRLHSARGRDDGVGKRRTRRGSDAPRRPRFRAESRGTTRGS